MPLIESAARFVVQRCRRIQPMRVTRNSSDVVPGETAVTIGNFDGVHRGHQAVLALLMDQARQRRLRPCVVTFEPHPREFFAPDAAPTRLTSLREKLELLSGQGVQQVHVCRFDYDFARRTAQAFIEETLVRQLGARWVMIGDDFRFGARRQGDYDLLRSSGGALGITVARMATASADGVRISSTRIRQALEAGELERAAELLGRRYAMSGRVIQGARLGGTLGFPTANLRVRHNRPPMMGIFVVEVQGLVAGTALPGVASLGLRPTVEAGGQALLEVHLLDFSGDLYGKHIRVVFLKKLRDEEKYPDLETLKRQISRDAEDARQYFATH